MVVCHQLRKYAGKIFQPTLTTIRQIPIMAWIPLLILWCGIGKASKIVIIGILMDKLLTIIFTALTPWERKRRERT